MLKGLHIMLFSILFVLVGNAQTASDNCDMASTVTTLDGSCITYTFSNATYDVLWPNCFPQPPFNNGPNVWLSFVAADPKVEISQGTASASNIYFALFSGDCTALTQIACTASGGQPIILNNLNVGETYYILIAADNGSGGTLPSGSFDLCIDNTPIPKPPNDLPCGEIPITVGPAGSPDCVNGTTLNADDNVTEGCLGFTPVHDVFYTFTMGSNQYGVKVDLNDLVGDISAILFQWNPDCSALSYFELESYCGPVGNDIIEYTGLTPGETYGLVISSQKGMDGTFSALCLEAIEPSCLHTNGACTSAESINGLTVGGSDVCVTGCNEFSSTGPSLAGCPALATQPTVWYEISTGPSIERLSIQISNAQMDAPVMQLFEGSCTALTAVGPCSSGSGGEVNISNLIVQTNTTYYLAVTNASGFGGTFDLCVRALDNPNACVTDANLSVQPGSPSFGSPDSGPYLPGESVTFCYELNSFNVDPPGTGNDCQWLHGIVPLFGDAWDMNLFDPSTTPPIVHNPGGSWQWTNGIVYKENSTYLTIEDFDGDGNIDICNSGDFGCPNTGTSAGSPMPPGWFFVGAPNGWGDGNGCGTTNGPWQFCFTLTTKTYPDCSDETPFLTDASVKIYTFADGETGSYVGGSGDICGADVPVDIQVSLNCCQGPEPEDPDVKVCPGKDLVLNLTNLNGDPVSKYTWTPINNPQITGASAGEGKTITDQLVSLNIFTSEIQEYKVIAFDLTGCPGPETIITVEVLPNLKVDAGDDQTLCIGEYFDLGGNPFTASGGAGNYTYAWSNLSAPKNTEAMPTGVYATTNAIYVVTVTDDNGCSNTDDVKIDVKPIPEIEVTGVFVLCKDGFGNLNATPLVGDPPFTYSWQNNDIYIPDGPNVTYQANVAKGTYTVTVYATDANNCEGTKEFDIMVQDAPQFSLTSSNSSNSFCLPNGHVGFKAELFSSSPDIKFTWTLPDNSTVNGDTLTATQSGTYGLLIEDLTASCSKDTSFMVMGLQPPNPSINAPTEICKGTTQSISTTQTYVAYSWDTGSSSASIDVGPGSYTVTVTDAGGCTAETSVTIQENAGPDASISGASTYCAGSSTILTTKANYASYKWYEQTANTTLSTTNQLDVNFEGTVIVEVIDAGGCIAYDTLIVTEEAFLTPVVTGDSMICPGFTTSLDAGTGFTTYEWTDENNTVVGMGQTLDNIAEGVYTLAVEDAFGCSGTAEVNVTINSLPKPKITADANATGFCPGGDLKLAANTGFKTYLWSDANASSTTSITVNSGGKYYLTVTDDEGCANIDSIDIEAFEAPKSDIDGNLQFCLNGQTKLTPDAGFVKYEWDTDNNNIVDVTNATADPIDVNFTGTITLIVTDGNGCTGSSKVELSNYEEPDPKTTTALATFCAGESVSISLNNDYPSISWKYNNVEVGTTQEISVTQAGTYTVDIIDVNGCSGTTQMEVEESDKLSPGISGDKKICDNTEITISADSGYDTYKWETGEETQEIKVSAEGSYKVTVTKGTCEGEGTHIVINETSPNISITVDNTSTCNNNEEDNSSFVDLSSLYTADPGEWTVKDNTITVDLTDPTNVNFEGVTPGTYTLVYTTNNAVAPCENVYDEITIEVKECLCPGIELKTIADQCLSGAIVDLDTLKLTNEPGTWAVDQGSDAVLNGNIFDPSKGDSGTYILSYNLTNPKAGCDEKNTIEIVVEKPPFAGIVQPKAIVCFGDDKELKLFDLLEMEDADGTWEELTSFTTGGAYDPSTGVFKTENQIVGNYIFDYKLPATAACPSANQNVFVDIVALPTADAGDDKELNCTIEEVQIGTDKSVGDNLVFKWFYGKDQEVLANTESIITVKKDGDYIMEVADANACVDSDTVKVTKNEDFPVITLDATDPLCADENTGKITTVAKDGTEPYTFSIDNGQTWLSQVEYNNLAAGNYTILVKDGNGCEAEAKIVLANPDKFEIDLGADIVMQHKTDTLITIDAFGGNIDAAVWTVNDSTVCSGSDCDSYRVTVDKEAVVCVKGVNENGCEAESCITIRRFTINTFYTGNTFTPNEDGENDVFYIQDGGDVELVNSFQIFDRWGEMVFSQKDFQPNDPSKGWDGSFRGKTLNSGVYVYVIDLKYKSGETIRVYGDVTLKK